MCREPEGDATWNDITRAIPGCKRMSPMLCRGMLGLDRDLPFQRCEWTLQRVWWLVIVAIVVAALSGAQPHTGGR